MHFLIFIIHTRRHWTVRKYTKINQQYNPKRFYTVTRAPVAFLEIDKSENVSFISWTFSFTDFQTSPAGTPVEKTHRRWPYNNYLLYTVPSNHSVFICVCIRININFSQITNIIDNVLTRAHIISGLSYRLQTYTRRLYFAYFRVWRCKRTKYREFQNRGLDARGVKIVRSETSVAFNNRTTVVKREFSSTYSCSEYASIRPTQSHFNNVRSAPGFW